MELNPRARRLLLYASIGLSLLAMFYALSALRIEQISFSDFVIFTALLLGIIILAPGIFLDSRPYTRAPRGFARRAPAGIGVRAQARVHYHMQIKYISGGETSYFYEINKPKELVESIALQIERLVPAIRFEGHRIYPKRVNEYKIFTTESPSEMSPESVRGDHPAGYDFGGDDVTLEITTNASKPTYHCKKCNTIVDLTDEKCPNGHDLSIVGKTIKLTLTEGLTLSDSVTLTSGNVINRIEDTVKVLEGVNILPETRTKIDELLEDVEALKVLENEHKVILSSIRERTSPPTLFQKIKENIIDYIITLVIGLIIGVGVLIF